MPCQIDQIKLSMYSFLGLLRALYIRTNEWNYCNALCYDPSGIHKKEKTNYEKQFIKKNFVRKEYIEQFSVNLIVGIFSILVLLVLPLLKPHISVLHMFPLLEPHILALHKFPLLEPHILVLHMFPLLEPHRFPLWEPHKFPLLEPHTCLLRIF